MKLTATFLKHYLLIFRFNYDCKEALHALTEVQWLHAYSQIHGCHGVNDIECFNYMTADLLDHTRPILTQPTSCLTFLNPSVVVYYILVYICMYAGNFVLKKCVPFTCVYVLVVCKSWRNLMEQSYGLLKNLSVDCKSNPSALGVVRLMKQTSGALTSLDIGFTQLKSICKILSKVTWLLTIGIVNNRRWWFALFVCLDCRVLPIAHS